MSQIISKISIKNSSGTYDTRDIGAKGQNVKVGYDASGKVILDVDTQTPTTTKQLTQVLQDAEKNISDLNKDKAPSSHAWSDADGVNYGLADETHYGHIKTGNGLTNNSGEVSVAYGTTSNTACQGDDSRLSDARKNPNAVTFSDGTTNTSYDGSSAKTVTAATIGAAPSGHTTVNATTSVLGHVKTGTGIANNSGTISVSYGTAAGTACQGNDSRLSNSRTPKSHAGSTASTYGAGNATNFGHVKVSDSYTIVDSAATAANSVAASAYALQSAYNELKSKCSGNEYKNITADFNNGTFSANLEKYNPGNYIKIIYNGVTYVAVLADFNTFYNPGRNDYANIQSNHWTSIIFGFAAGQMNATNTTNGGYKKSAMHKWLMSNATNAVKNAFGTSHLVAHRCFLSDGTYNASSVTHGFSWGWDPLPVYLVLPSEAQLGYRGWSDSGWSTGEASKTLDIFQNESFMSVFGRNYGQSNNTFNAVGAWLRDICAFSPGESFCFATYDGIANGDSASNTHGCFPLAILK